MKKIWIVLMEQEWEFGKNSSAGVDYYLEHVSAHSTEEAATEAAKRAGGGYKVRIVSLDVDGPGCDILD